MSASAGRVLVMHKGDYDSGTAYKPMDEVYYQGSTYRCKADSTGNLPTNATYWQLVSKGVATASDLGYDNSVSGLTADDVQEAIDELADEKQDALTFDSAPTEDSTNPVESGGVYTALSGKQNTLTFDNTPTENSTNPVKSGGVYSAIEDVADYAENNISAIVNVYGSKNLLPYPYYETTKSASGLTFTDNGDGTVTIGAGTASANVTLQCRANSNLIGSLKDGGKYILSGCPSGGSLSTYYLNYYTYHNSEYHFVASDIGEGADFTYHNVDYDIIEITILSGTVISSPITFKPMIRDARITDPTYVSFAMTNSELTEKVNGIDEISVTVANASTNPIKYLVDNGYIIPTGKLIPFRVIYTGWDTTYGWLLKHSTSNILAAGFNSSGRLIMSSKNGDTYVNKYIDLTGNL